MLISSTVQAGPLQELSNRRNHYQIPIILPTFTPRFRKAYLGCDAQNPRKWRYEYADEAKFLKKNTRLD
jgi:hypothetical protein